MAHSNNVLDLFKLVNIDGVTKKLIIPEENLTIVIKSYESVFIFLELKIEV